MRCCPLESERRKSLVDMSLYGVGCYGFPTSASMHATLEGRDAHEAGVGRRGGA